MGLLTTPTISSQEQDRHILGGIPMDTPPKRGSVGSNDLSFSKRQKLLKVNKNGFWNRNRISAFGYLKNMLGLQDLGLRVSRQEGVATCQNPHLETDQFLSG